MKAQWLQYLKLGLLSFLGALLLWIASATPSQSHWADLSVAEIVVGQTKSDLTLTFPTGLTAFADDDRNGKLSASEVRTHQSQLQKFLSEQIRLVSRNDRDGTLTSVQPFDAQPSAQATLPTNLPIAPDTHSTLRLTYTWTQPIQALTVNYNLFLPGVSTASCLATIRQDQRIQTFVFSPDNREFSLQPSAWQQIWSFLGLGIEHILTGYDHILFLVSLLLLGGGLKSLLKMVTAFTVAHSATLSLAVLDLVSLPPQWVESAIALTIVYVAAENFWRKSVKGRWQLAFGFGLIHGLGFAGILQEINIPRVHLALSLASFNLGVEIGQVAIVTIAFLGLRQLRKMPWEPYFRRWISAGIVLIGLLWFVQRTFA
ncbi:HupE/UreJ family protein [Altericista sp. CCNU0014]|uniref:HupE/UreJ family protein n=1 Tax=Altericista sp. CCNU0014 TaxID=3082949 RepID=UPI00384C624D